MDEILKWIKSESSKLIYSAIIIFITIIILLIIKIIVVRFNKRVVKKRAITLSKLIQNICKYVLVILAILGILSIWGVNVTTLIAGAGIVGLVVGLGAQQLIKDFLSGISIIFEDYYEIDDIVEIKGFKGKVIEIGLRSTKLMNWKGELKIFANGDISEVTNFSRNFSIASIVVGIAYKEDINKVTTLLDEKLPIIKESYSQIIEGPNVIGVDDLGQNGVNIRINAKTTSEEHYAVERAMRKFVKELFDEANIEIPYNQIVVHNER